MVSICGTGTTTVNGSDHSLTTPCDIINLTLNFLILVMALAGLAGNAIVLWLLGFHIRRNAFTVYVLNLSGADFLFLSCQTVYSLRSIIGFFHPFLKYIPEVFFIGFMFTYLASLSMLSAISAERCLSVLRPIWYRCGRPRHTSVFMCALLWTLSLLFSLLNGKACGYLMKSFDYHSCQTFDFLTAAWVMVLFLVLSGSSLILLVRVFSSQRVPVTRLYVTIALTVLVFLLFGLPFGMEWFLLSWIEDLNFLFLCYSTNLTEFLSSVNSCINPVIYFFVGSIRRHRFQSRRRRPCTLKLILQKAMQDIPEEEEDPEMHSSDRPREVEIVWGSS